VPKQHSPWGGAQRCGGRDERTLSNGEDFGPHEARNAHPSGQHENGYDRANARLPQRHADEQQHEPRQREKDVGERCHGAIDKPFTPSGERTERGAEQSGGE